MQVRLGEVRPEHVGHVELRVADLPEEVVGDPHLPGGPDKQVGVGQADRRQTGCERRLVDRLRIEPAVAGVAGQRPGGVDDLLTAAVVEGQNEGHPGAARRRRLALGERREDRGGHALVAADAAEADAVLEQRRTLRGEVLAAEEHERVDLLRGTFPVLAREGVERERLDAEPGALGHDPANALGALAMTEHPWHAALRGPAPVAIHDHGDVAGESRRVRRGRGRVPIDLGFSRTRDVHGLAV